MQINTYLMFNGQCREAFEFYAQCLGGKIESMFTHGESPMCDQVTPEWRDKVMHAHIVVDGNMLMGSDAPSQQNETPQGFSVNINVETPAEAERIYRELAEGGTVHMAIQETFWAQRFAALVDRFGTPWMINCLRECEDAASSKAAHVGKG